ncbi:MAG TPA: ribosome silencing factor [Opitutaceae bacterium]|nr:ribosome silencing factor [Opitutaceae bacterium]
MKPTEAQSMELVRLCCRALDEKKAGDLRVLDVRALSSITDYLVIGTATSEPHVRALRVELEKALDSVKTHIVGFETARESGWAVMDAFDVMVHIFTPEKRDRYRLEALWRDARDVPLRDLLAGRKRPAKLALKPKRKASPGRPRKGAK